MDLRECYSVLEVPGGAPLSEIVKAHKDLVLVWHPDRFNQNPDLRKKAEEKLKQINEAYNRLKNISRIILSSLPRHLNRSRFITLIPNAVILGETLDFEDCRLWKSVVSKRLLRLHPAV